MNYEILKCESTDTQYPKALNILNKKPTCIYYVGDIGIMNREKNVAIVGSRDCSDYARQLAFEAGRMAAKKNLTVVNGLAIGCDTEALLGALDCNGRCVVILPGGLNQIYPKQNEKLAERIVDAGGCLISEYPPDAKPQKYTFVERDRIQSGISQGVLVIETTSDGGTMHTANAAVRQAKRLAVYASALLKNATGNQLLEEQHKASVIRNTQMLEEFMMSLPDIEENRQLSIFDM